jgi:hypothetical protein
VVNVTDPYGRILDFLDRVRYFFIQVAPQLISRGSVDPVPEGILMTRPSSGNKLSETRASGRFNTPNSAHDVAGLPWIPGR